MRAKAIVTTGAEGTETSLALGKRPVGRAVMPLMEMAPAVAEVFATPANCGVVGGAPVADTGGSM